MYLILNYNRAVFLHFSGKLNMSGQVMTDHVIVDPIHLKLDLKRALPPHRDDIHYDLVAQMHKVKVNLLQTDLKVIMAVLRENLSEEGHMPTFPGC